MKIAAYLTHHDVVCWNLTESHARRLEAELPGVEVVLCRDKASFLAALPGAHGALVWKFREEWLEKAERLEWIATPAAGRDYFQISPEAPVRLIYGSFHGQIMAETVLAWLLSETRGLRRAEELRREGALWPRGELEPAMRTLRGSRLTILGFGKIGVSIGRLVKPFGANITGVKRSAGGEPDYFTREDAVVPVAELDTVLPVTDHLVMVLPSGKDTDNILDARRLALLPPGAVIYNVGRGNAIDEAALCEGLGKGHIRAAYLDVFQQEPLPADSPLRKIPNLLMMPHASAMAPHYLDLFLDEFIANFRKKCLK